MSEAENAIRDWRATLRSLEAHLQERRKLRDRLERLIAGAETGGAVASINVAQTRRTITRLNREIAGTQQNIMQIKHEIADLQRRIADEKAERRRRGPNGIRPA